jgi:hypothetical protein
MKKILIVAGVLVVLLILFALGSVWHEYHDEDGAMSRSEQIVNDMETHLSQLESKIQTATSGDPGKAPTDETRKIGEEILKIQHDLNIEELVFGMGSSRSKLISEKRKVELSARMKAVNEHYNRVLEKYHNPLGVQRRS